MRLSGMQKLTLLDDPGHLACTLFAPGCNFRCPFCHNASLVLAGAETLDTEQVFAFLRKRRGVLQGVCLTGGEPLLQPDAADFLARVKDLGYHVKLDTNGAFPGRLRSAVERGVVDYVAMDVKNDPENYGLTVGLDDFDLGPVRESVSYLLSGAVDYEFRTTVVRELHDEARLVSLARWIAGARRYFLQAFADSGDLILPGLTGFSASELHALLAAVRAVLPAAQLRGV